MALSPGDVVLCGDTISYVSRTSAVDPGDAVALSSGEIDAATDADTLTGVATADGLALSGVVVANVDTDDADGAATEGVSLSLSPDAGEFYRSYNTDVDGNVTGYNSGPVTALSSEGGTWQGHDVPAGYAVVHINFHR